METKVVLGRHVISGGAYLLTVIEADHGKKTITSAYGPVASMDYAQMPAFFVAAGAWLARHASDLYPYLDEVADLDWLNGQDWDVMAYTSASDVRTR